MSETIHHPNHYQSSNGIECWAAIAAVTEDLTGAEAFDTGNIIKYAWRWKKKNGIEDLKKIIEYTNHLISLNQTTIDAKSEKITASDTLKSKHITISDILK